MSFNTDFANQKYFLALKITFEKTLIESTRNMWDKVLKSGLSKLCGRQPLKNL